MKMDYATWGILAAGLLVLALLLWQLLRLRGTLRREREENRRLRDLLQAGSQLAQADQAQLRQLRHDLRHYLVLAEEAGCLTAEGGRIRPDERVTEDEVRQFLSAKVGKAPTQVPGNLTHGDFFLLAAPLL